MSDQNDLACKVEPIDDGVVVHVSGEINVEHSPQLRVDLLKLLEQRPARLIVHLGNVPFMDSSGVAVFVEAYRMQRPEGRMLVLCAMSPKVRSIFEISKLDTVFTIVDDLEAAVKA